MLLGIDRERQVTRRSRELSQRKGHHMSPAPAGRHCSQALDPKANLQIAMKNLDSTDWELKMDGIRRIDDLLATCPVVLQAEIHTVALALMDEVRNLRSQVSRAAIQCIAKLLEHFGKHMEQDLDRIVPLLLQKTGDTNRFIRDDARAALINVTRFVTAPKAIVAIVNDGVSHKNANVRAEAAKLLAAVVERLGASKSLSGAKDVTERILPAAVHFSQESSPEARAHGKKMLNLLMQDPVFEKAAHKYLTAAALNQVKRSFDTRKKTTMSPANSARRLH